MKNWEKSIKIILPLTTVILFVIFNFKIAAGAFTDVKKLFYPIFVGIIVSLVLSIPIEIFEKKIYKFKKEKVNRGLAIFTVIVISLALIAGICLLIIPEIINSIEIISEKLPEITKNPIEFLKRFEWGQKIEESLDKIIGTISQKLQEYLPNLIKYLSDLAMSVINLLIGLFLGVLIIIDKKNLAEQKDKLEEKLKFKGKRNYIEFCKFMAMAKDKFSKFLSGQLLEALIFGVFVYIACVIFKTPYALLIAFIMAVSNLIPMIGGYVGGILSFIFIATVSLNQALIFVIFIVILQQIEQVTTYPIIVGKNVKLSGFWVLSAVLIGGGLFGFWGLILSVPLLATLFEFFIPTKNNLSN